jgi:hypothetical protein
MRNTVADNKTYKDQYHFRDDFKIAGEDYPSIKGPADINTTIKENPYRSNVEIEGGEVVLQPDLSALFKANGKKHSGGGMDVLLRPNAFVFSDFKDLAITEKEKELFEFKMGGSTSPTKNTPAEVLKKNVNVKHYNTLINNITDPYKDDLGRKSSAMMLEKYIGTLGNIAFLQEKKKDFPDGLPDFSMGSAPVFESNTKQEVDESKQFAKYGGKIAEGGYPDLCPCGKDSKGNCLPCSDTQLRDLRRKAPKGTLDQTKGMNKLGVVDNAAVYHVGTDPTMKNITVPLGIPGGQMNDQWKRKMQSLIDQGATLDQLVTQKHGTKEGLSKMFKFPVNTPGTDKLLYVEDAVPTPGFNPTPKTPAPPTPGVPEVTGQPQGVKRVDWQFTPWQKVSQLYNWGQYAGVRRYMPARSRYNATYADPSLLNPEQTVGDVKGQVNQQLSALGTLNPIMRNAQAASAYGAALNQIPNIRTQYDNQNAQIANQFRQYNNQVRNNESLVNMQNDQQYYQQAVEGRKNFDNLRSFASNNAMNNVLRDVETNQKLAYNLLTQNNPAYSYDWKTGDFTRNQKDIRDSLPSNSNDFYGDFLKELEEARTPEDLEKLKIKERLMRQKNILPYLQQSSSAFAKKGGKMKNPYK